jgi:ADP-L-glycero-D-manno-heptose 6-epimerase
MIVLTGAAGFIGSYLARKLNDYRVRDIVLVDDFSRIDKERNLEGLRYVAKIDRKDLFEVLERDYAGKIDSVFHLGARTDTTEQDKSIFDSLNLEYSKKIWNYCSAKGINLIYASSAATYGDGSLGYDDRTHPNDLKPLNPYGESKNDFDKWVMEQTESPSYWLGLKFFNVYGPGEFHKGRMASVVYHAYRQIKEKGKVRLFRSHRDDYADGEQKRDFIYVDDIAEFIWFAYKYQPKGGLMNMGTGQARSFLDLVNAVFSSLNMEPQIEFIDTPLDIRDSYQYFTQAEMHKLNNSNYPKPFHSLEEGVSAYIRFLVQSEEKI